MANGKRGRPKKDPFDLLSSEFKDGVAGSSPEQINEKIAEIAKKENENKRLMKEDPHLAECKVAVKEAAAQYTEATKYNNQAIAFMVQVLGDKGADNGSAV